MVIPENVLTSSIIQTEKVIFRNIYAYTYMYLTTINENKKSEEGYIGVLGGRKEKGEMLQF